LQQILSAVASGKGLASVLRGLNLSQAQRNRINNYINDMDEEDKKTISGFGSASASAGNNETQQVATSNKFIVDARPQDPEEAKLWNSIFGPYFAPDGNVIESAIQEYAIGNSMVEQLIDKYKQSLLALEVEKEQRSMNVEGASA